MDTISRTVISQTICQFDASSSRGVSLRFRRSLANLHGPFFRLLLRLLLFSPYFLSIPSPSLRWYNRCCWPVRFLALKIYSLYKWNPMSRAPRPLLRDSCRIASCALSCCVYCFRVLRNIIAATSWIAASSQGRFEVGRKSWRNYIDTRIGHSPLTNREI